MLGLLSSWRFLDIVISLVMEENDMLSPLRPRVWGTKDLCGGNEACMAQGLNKQAVRRYPVHSS